MAPSWPRQVIRARAVPGGRRTRIFTDHEALRTAPETGCGARLPAHAHARLRARAARLQGAERGHPAHPAARPLAAELKEQFPGHPITVINRGVNGEEARDMLARFPAQVIGEKPDLVLWQGGTNSVLRDYPPAPAQPANSHT